MCKLEWSPCLETGASPIYSYDVYMREGDTGDWIKVNEDEVFVPSFSIKDKLTPGKFYSFKIEATNEAGLSSNSNIPTESVRCPSLADAKFNAPTVEIKSSNSVNVKWERPAELPPEESLNFNVLYKSDESSVWNKVPASELGTEIKDLKPGLSYVFRIEVELPDSTTLSSEKTLPVLLPGRHHLVVF